ncbi:hypothetical protein TNCV_2907901 [Trichonephila clavipes]|nr:hypothetical protein TNCV_2907901 [Trichonephila clavipes]
MGPKKTLERIKYSFFWEGLRADVKKFCESCKECQLTRSSRVESHKWLASGRTFSLSPIWRIFATQLKGLPAYIILEHFESKISCFDPPHLSPCSFYRNNFFLHFDFQANCNNRCLMDEGTDELVCYSSFLRTTVGGEIFTPSSAAIINYVITISPESQE